MGLLQRERGEEVLCRFVVRAQIQACVSFAPSQLVNSLRRDSQMRRPTWLLTRDGKVVDGSCEGGPKFQRLVVGFDSFFRLAAIGQSSSQSVP